MQVLICKGYYLFLGETDAMDATTTICHRHTPPEQLATFTKTADIIVSAAGGWYFY